MLSAENEKRIINWIEEHKDEFIADLSKIIAVPSVHPRS